MTESPAAVFGRLVAAGPPERADVLLGTACVLGGSIAGLLAARVLADHAERVVVIERDAVGAATGPRLGVPQRSHLHALVPAGREWLERWLPGFTRDMRDGGAVFTSPGQNASYQDGRPRLPAAHYILQASRTFLEDGIRARVLALPNVSMLHAQTEGLEYQGKEVRGVRYRSGDGSRALLPADFVVDAMGRASRLPDWLAEDGFDRPVLERLAAPINYSTALFKRTGRAEELPTTLVAAHYGPPYPGDGVAIAGVAAIENDQWIVTLIGYDDARPGRTTDAFRAACSQLTSLFAEVAAGELTEEIAFYRQAESRRRDFAALDHRPARVLSAGDAVASFNPIYGQGMTSAALHA